MLLLLCCCCPRNRTLARCLPFADLDCSLLQGAGGKKVAKDTENASMSRNYLKAFNPNLLDIFM